MNARGWYWLLVVLLLAFMFGELAFYYPQLPQRVASHFDFQGNPNGWSTKQEFAIACVVAFALLSIFLLPAPWLTARGPKWLINMPRRDYWFAREREAETRTALASRIRWMCFATMLLLVMVFHEVIQANLRPRPQIRSAMPLMIVYFVFLAFWLAEFLWRFARVPRDDNQ